MLLDQTVDAGPLEADMIRRNGHRPRASLAQNAHARVPCLSVYHAVLGLARKTSVAKLGYRFLLTLAVCAASAHAIICVGAAGIP